VLQDDPNVRPAFRIFARLDELDEAAGVAELYELLQRCFVVDGPCVVVVVEADVLKGCAVFVSEPSCQLLHHTGDLVCVVFQLRVFVAGIKRVQDVWHGGVLVGFEPVVKAVSMYCQDVVWG